MSTNDNSLENLLALFGDDLARQILLLTSDTPLSADTLAETLDVSRPTIYRRVNTLIEYELLTKDLETDSDGHHYAIFEPSIQSIRFTIDDGELEITVEMNDPSIDHQFEGFLDGLGTAYAQESISMPDHSDTPPSQEDCHYG